MYLSFIFSSVVYIKYLGEYTFSKNNPNTHGRKRQPLSTLWQPSGCGHYRTSLTTDFFNAFADLNILAMYPFK